MASFFYRVRNREGKVITGYLEADGEAAAAVALRRSNYVIIDIRPAPEKARQFNLTNLCQLLEPRVSVKELALFCRQFATMLGAGVPILNCLHVLSQQAENKKLRRTISQLIDHLQSGSTLTEAMRMFPRIFPPVFIHMVDAGEMSGTLEQVLENLATHFEKEHDLKEKIKSAMIYPIIISLVAALVVTGLLTFVLPNFVNVLNQLHVELPFSTRLIIKASDLLKEYWYLVLGGITFLVFFGKWYFHSERGGEVYSRVSLRLPVFGKVLEKVIIARFCRTLGTLLRSGVPVLRALEAVKKVTGNRLVTRAIDKAEENIREGQGIARPLAQSGVFPPMVIRMVTVGEETGALEGLLEKVAVFYEREVDATVSRLAAIVEPVMIVGMGLVVGFIVVSMLLPMLDVISSVH